ncbi:hypothetical protein AB6A40_007192 [Gnathostoma spinigerum]|uniref:Ig-like domain-containing protein n=1 Tax=Gnathostoma spinigerum TaxID=75299 RepID=A0ABD6EKH4_9BILA
MFHVLIVWLLFKGFAVCISAKPTDAFAQGNLQVVVPAKNAKSRVVHPQKVEIPDLWCQARLHSTNELLPIKKAQFTRMSDRTIIKANINNTRATLQFGKQSITSAGKYRCEITSEQGHYVWGWLFAYVRPVFHINQTRFVDVEGDEDKFHVAIAATRITEGESVRLECPAYGFPAPTIEWLKDGQPIESNERITFLNQAIEISKLVYDDDGVYTCLAKNAFSLRLDYPKQLWISRLDQRLRVQGSYRWIYPLIIIIILIVVLFLIIFGCSAINRVKSYNVEKREKRIKRNADHKGDNPEQLSQHQPILGVNKGEAE